MQAIYELRPTKEDWQVKLIDSMDIEIHHYPSFTNAIQNTISRTIYTLWGMNLKDIDKLRLILEVKDA